MIEEYQRLCLERILEDSGNTIGEGVKIPRPDLVNIYGAEIGSETQIGPFVEIQKNVVIGERVKVQSHAFICEGVVIEDGAFIGHGVVFTNDRNPRAVNDEGRLITSYDEWVLETTLVEREAVIGSNATILPGVRIGRGSVIGAGAVVTKSTEPSCIYVGNPAIRMKKDS